MQWCLLWQAFRLRHLLLGGMVLGAVTGSVSASAQLFGVEEGLCDRIPQDPVTGERLLYCCLDELFVMEQEGAQQDVDGIARALLKVRLTGGDDDEFFRQPYESPLHEKYGWQTPCGPPVPCEQCVKGPACGNGVLQVGEQCDDGNGDDGDGCNYRCVLEPEGRRAFPGCGDNVVAPQEECDDGNKRDGDGCSAVCTVESLVCGNGMFDPGEECDDGNRDNLDGCSADCRSEAMCSDGVLSATEECDDGNMLNGDGCDANCTKEYKPTILPTEEQLPPVVPQHPVAPLPRQQAASSQSTDQQPAAAVVPSEVVIDVPPLVEGVCGNGVLDAYEECDDGNRDGDDGCGKLCRSELGHRTLCGNGLIEPPEACDDGNVRRGDACAPDCTIQQRIELHCGNFFLDPDEECDDGNVSARDGCSGRCVLEQGARPYCGDTILTAGEQCDDGGTDSDGCSQNCRIETAIVVPYDSCGNSVLDPGEECDDGNDRDEDGCSATCFYELGGRGDAIVQRALGEQCDPALVGVPCNRSGRFIVPSCGNGELNPLEECDDGKANTIRPGAACRPDCSRGACGDSIVDPGEECDDGNLVNGDECSRLCHLVAKVQLAGIPKQAGAPPPLPYPAAPQNQAQLMPQYLRTQPTEGWLSDTGPTVILFMAAGAAAGMGWMRRRLK